MKRKAQITEEQTKQLPLVLRNTLNDIIGAAGMLYFLIYEEFTTQCDTLLPPLGLATDKYYDLKKGLVNPIKKLSETAHMINIRGSKSSAFLENQNDQYALFLAFKALCRLTSAEINDEAIRLSRNEPNFTTRTHFMVFFESVLEKSRQSNHDAIQMIQSLYDTLQNDADGRIIYDKEISDFKLSQISTNS
ncbi:hypothetical protein KO02_12095 [Sphingobacterium sp. ML3W]|uniref:hypothetical protein n=1 Tax=Sphingobacterium sp. ML3W TaxID=1538644 RepID=UPI0004F60D5A|nr:hypothetical protein [Sphingobacterium sp. ML3W]AIM37351.1 hypothetical protein KO02_12095 [Sphingobacterium sp. ML3W]